MEIKDTIALTPEDCRKLDQAGISYRIPEDYFLVKDILPEMKDFHPVSDFDKAMSLCFFEQEKMRLYWKKFQR